MLGPTHTDVGRDRWELTDEVVRLREWATDASHDLPKDSAGPVLIGSAPGCWLQLTGEGVSRNHASLRREEGKWLLRDVGSKNGILLAGIRRDKEVELAALQEFWLGGITLIAESSRSIALRSFLGRLLGWGSDRIRAVDLALRAVRTAIADHSALILCGTKDLLLAARSIHRYALGDDRPFVLCDPRRERADENVRAAQNYKLGLQALAAAKHGSICVWNNALPSDFAALSTALQDPGSRTQLIVCTESVHEVKELGMLPVIVPSLSHRQQELPRIISEYAADATAELGLPRASFADVDEGWILHNAASSLSDIGTTILRVLAIREAKGVLNRAAARLGMRRSSLQKWVRRRPNLPVPAVT